MREDATVVLMRLLSPALVFTALLAPSLFAQQEVGLTVGVLSGPSRTAASGAALNLSETAAFQVNYARVVKRYKFADMYGEVHFMASPSTTVTSTLTSATNSFSSLFLTPGVRFKFYPHKLLSPWVVAGGGYAHFLQSDKTIAGAVNAAPRHRSTGAIAYGAGLDYAWSPRLTFRAEARYFYTGSARFNTPVSGRQVNFVVGAGIVFHPGSR
jgi:opacity protein-like surface antigen